MTSPRSPTASRPTRRATRPRPTPKWLHTDAELNQIAQRRCLQLLSVLSGEKSVSEAIAEMEVSRGTYYQLETKALAAMLSALAPGTESVGPTSSQQLLALEKKVKTLEQTKRRLERLLFLTRRVVKPGPVKVGQGRPRGRSGKASRPGRPSSTPTPPPVSNGPSTPTKAGESGQNSGSAS